MCAQFEKSDLYETWGIVEMVDITYFVPWFSCLRTFLGFRSLKQNLSGFAKKEIIQMTVSEDLPSSRVNGNGNWAHLTQILFLIQHFCCNNSKYLSEELN